MSELRVAQALREATLTLAQVSDTARLDAELLAEVEFYQWLGLTAEAG